MWIVNKIVTLIQTEYISIICEKSYYYSNNYKDKLNKIINLHNSTKKKLIKLAPYKS